MKSDNNNYYYN